ncbi:Hpt domain-containing response regulator [Lysobacter sp. A378]
MNTTPDLPRILLVEDDPTSAAFLAAAVGAVPARVDCSGSVAAAAALANAGRYDLWLLDASLPDGTGAALLAQLQAMHPDIPGIAHTASREPAVLEALALAGFKEVLVKPLSSAHLQATVRQVLGLAAGTGTDIDVGTDITDNPPLWDDEAAATALNGNRDHIETLRRLFSDELPSVRQRVMAAAGAGQLDQLHDELHKLRASCGFVGAARLGASVQALQQGPETTVAISRFDAAAQATLDGLRASTSTDPWQGRQHLP